MMPQWLRNILLQTVALLMGRSQGASVNLSGTGTNVTGTIYDVQIANNNKYNVNYCLPYGYTSIPVDGTPTVIGNLGVSGNSILSMGCIAQSSPTDILSGLSQGEAGIKSSAGYATVIQNTRVGYIYNNLSATACSGEDVQQILIDICQQLQSLITTQLPAIWSAINSHNHIEAGSGRTQSMTSSGTTISQPSINSFIVSDQTFCESGKLLINSNGITPVR